MTSAFMSYSRKDQHFTQKLTTGLQERGPVEVWIDWADVSVGSEWWAKIRNGIESSDNFICVVSTNWIGCHTCQNELDYALQQGKRIIPIILEPIPEDHLTDYVQSGNANPEFSDKDPIHLVQQNWRAISRINWLIYNADDDFERFLEQVELVINEDPEYIRRHTHYLVSARKWDYRGRKSDYLLHGEELQEAIFWLEHSDNKDPAPTELHRQYIKESVEHSQSAQNILVGAIQSIFKRLWRSGPRKIFISYRRADSADACGRIYDRLEERFGKKNIFLDVTSIDYGADFSQFIQDTLKDCFAMLVVIGPQWLEMLKERAASDEPDFVKIEIETALKRHHVNVIPLFVGGASMPAKEELPASLQELVLRNGTPIRAGREFHNDMDDLVKELNKLRRKASES